MKSDVLKKFGVIQERNQELNDVLKLKNEETDDLHKQVDKLETEKIVWEVKFSTTESARNTTNYVLLWSQRTQK